MGEGILAALSNLFSAIGGYFGLAKQRDLEKNQAPIVAGKVAAQEQAAVDKTSAAIAQQDLAEMRKEDAE